MTAADSIGGQSDTVFYSLKFAQLIQLIMISVVRLGLGPVEDCCRNTMIKEDSMNEAANVTLRKVHHSYILNSQHSRHPDCSVGVSDP